MATATQPEWIPACEALTAVCKHYLVHTCKAEPWCREEGKKMLLRRMKFGQLPARAMAVDQALDYGDIKKDAPFARKMGDPFEVPVEFWEMYDDLNPNEYWFDWVAGDFYCETAIELSDDGNDKVTVKNIVIGLQVDARYLFRDPINRATSSESVPNLGIPGRSKGGRPPANWWPDFAEELAWYVYEVGFPAGEGRDGQSEMIEAIFERMAAAGKPEATRTTIQSVINALLDRFRSAGK